MSSALRQRIGDLLAEWRARRVGRRHVTNDLGHLARDVTGPTGFALSRTWDRIDNEHADRYRKSFDRGRPPPSSFISARDAARFNRAVPLPERCIEDHRSGNQALFGHWDMAELDSDLPPRPD